MTREEAIKVLERYEPIEWGDDQDAFDMAIEALTHECDSCIYNVCNYNSVPWESNGDQISRQAAMSAIYNIGAYMGRKDAMDTLKALPSAEPKGTWKRKGAYGESDMRDAYVMGLRDAKTETTPSAEPEREDMYAKFREWLSAEADDVWEYYAEADDGELTQRAKEDCKEMLLYGYTKGKNERESGWIPVSERLPSEHGEYLVFYEGTIIVSDIDIMWYGEPLMPNVDVSGKHFYRSDGEWGDIIYDEVTAWMPLPEPYKGGDSE